MEYTVTLILILWVGYGVNWDDSLHMVPGTRLVREKQGKWFWLSRLLLQQR